MRRTGLAVAFSCVALASGCREPAPRIFQVGEHRVAVVVPAGWEALDYGRRIVFKSEMSELALSDLGPARPEGFRDEVLRAQSLWRDGRDEEARTRLRELPVRAGLFATPDDFDRFHEVWAPVVSVPGDTAWDVVAPKFGELLGTLEAMQPAPLDRIADDVLPLLGHDGRREVKSRRAIRVDDRVATAIETWMTLTHADPRRLIMIIDGGRVLVLRCDRCDQPASEAFDELASSLQFASGSRK